MVRFRSMAIGGGFASSHGRRHAILQDEEPNTATATPPASGQQGAGNGNGNGATNAATPNGTQGTPPATPAAQLPAGVTAEQLQSITGPIVQQVSQHMQTELAPIREQQAELRGRMEELRQPIEQASALFNGGAPGVRRGEDPLSSRGYHYQRVLGSMQGVMGADQCKVETDISNRLRNFYVQQGFRPVGVRANGIDPILVPFGSGMVPPEALTEVPELQEVLNAGLDGANPNEMRWMQQRAGLQRQALVQALSIFDDTAMGVFTDPDGGQLIELVRKREVLSRAGARTIALPPNGYLPLPKHVGATTGYWVGELQAITESEPSTGRLELRARKAGVLVPFPNELLRFSFGSAEAFIRADIARVLSLLMDSAGLEGVGSSTTPLGILNHDNIIPYTAGTTGTDGNTLEPDDPAGMIAEVEEVDHDVDADGFAFLMRSKMWKNIRTRRTDAAAEGDAAGPWLFDVNRSDIAKGAPMMLEGWPVHRSGQISNTRAKGASSDLTYILGGIFSNVIIGRAGVLEFAMATEGDTMFARDESKIRAIQHCDVGLRYENAFVLCDSLDMDLPAS